MTEFQPARPDFAEAVRNLHEETPLAAHMGVTLVRIEPGRVTAELILKPEHTQQHGYAHAGTIAALADVVCGLAAYSLMDEGRSVVSININLSLMRPATGERLRADGRVVKAGQKIYFTEADIYAVNHTGEKLAAKASATMTAV